MLVPPSSPAVLSADLLQAARDYSDTLAELDDELLFNSDVQGERCVGCNVQLHIQAFQVFTCNTVLASSNFCCFDSAS